MQIDSGVAARASTSSLSLTTSTNGLPAGPRPAPVVRPGRTAPAGTRRALYGFPVVRRTRTDSPGTSSPRVADAAGEGHDHPARHFLTYHSRNVLS
jgi:hypothetical protein